MGATQFEIRIAAIKDGKKTYQGKPCIHGHDGTRYAVTGQCVFCAKARALARQKRIQEAVQEARASRESE